MNRVELMNRVRSNLNDSNYTMFTEDDILDYINEGIDRIKQVISELGGMVHLVEREDVPSLLPLPYHHLLSIYSTSRCFAKDERHYQATTLMNEFEYKLTELKDSIINGEIVITNQNGEPIDSNGNPEYVIDNYFNKRNYDNDCVVM